MSGIIINPYSFATGSAFSTKSLNFDGVDDYIELPITSAYTVTSLSMWVKTSKVFGANVRDSLASNNNFNQGRDFCIADTPSTTNDAYISMFAGAQIYGKTAASGGIAVNDGNWHHLVWTYDATAGTSAAINMYVDGVNQYSEAANTSWWTREVKYQYFGKPMSASAYFTGNIDEISIFNTVLSPSDITTLYNSGTPTDLTGESGLIYWWRMGENSTFYSPQILMPENTNKDKFSNYSMDFDGVSSYIDTSDATLVNGYTDVTFSGWINVSSLAANWEGILCSRSGSDYIIIHIANIVGSTYTLYIQQQNGGGGTYTITYTLSLNFDSWYHFAIMGSVGGKWDMYINGSNAAQVQGSNTIGGITQVGSFKIGRDYASRELVGKIDEVSIFDEVKAIGDLWDGTGKPTDLSGESGLVGWWRMGEEAIFNSTNWLLPNKAQDVYSRYSLDFDGVGDYITPSISLNTLSVSSSFSVSCWVNISTNSNYDHIIGAPSSYAAWDTGFGLYCNGSGIRFWVDQWNGTNQYVETAALNTDEWYNIIATFDTTNGLKLYVNGSTLTTASGTTIDGLTNTMYLGATGTTNGYNFIGQLNNIAIWNSELSALNAAAIYGTGTPTDLTSLSPSVWWKMGADATFSTNWTVPDQIGSNNGTSANMTNDDLTGDAPGVTGNGTSANMTIEDRTGDAPDSSNNALSYNMDEADIEEEAP